jgi:hypothetical protein
MIWPTYAERIQGVESKIVAFVPQRSPVILSLGSNIEELLRNLKQLMPAKRDFQRTVGTMGWLVSHRSHPWGKSTRRRQCAKEIWHLQKHRNAIFRGPPFVAVLGHPIIEVGCSTSNLPMSSSPPPHTVHRADFDGPSCGIIGGLRSDNLHCFARRRQMSRKLAWLDMFFFVLGCRPTFEDQNREIGEHRSKATRGDT